MNLVRTGLLLALLTALFVGVGAIVGGQTGMVIAFLIALVMNAFAYWNSDSMVLRMHGAIEVDERTAPELTGIVRQLVANADLPMPRVCILHNPQPNAFATGRDPEHATVCASTGLLELLSKEEVAGVMAHELAHVKNRDTLTMAVTATLAGAISMLANFGLFFGGRSRDNPLGPIGTIVLLIGAPLAATLVQMGISRTREYSADALGAVICQRPLWLASALRKLSQLKGRYRNPTAERFPATSHLFIVNPLTPGGLAALFTTHPPLEERIARLEEIARDMGQVSGPGDGRPVSSIDVMRGGGRNGGPWG
ncbi:MAG: zinc metalloprotease HtpX [Hyphomicrobiaceae bacterium]